MLDENLIATLEQSLRQTRNAQNRLMSRLRDVEGEAERLRQEIAALDDSAAKTNEAIVKILETIGPNGALRPLSYQTEEIDVPYDHFRMPKAVQDMQTPMRSAYTGNPISYISQPAINDPKPFVSSISSIERVSNRFSDRTITQACTLLLRETGRPLHVNELFNMLVAGGMEFKGNNPTISIAVSLNRNRRFHKVAPGTFDLVIRDAAKVG